LPKVAFVAYVVPSVGLTVNEPMLRTTKYPVGEPVAAVKDPAAVVSVTLPATKLVACVVGVAQFINPSNSDAPISDAVP